MDAYIGALEVGGLVKVEALPQADGSLLALEICGEGSNLDGDQNDDSADDMSDTSDNSDGSSDGPKEEGEPEEEDDES